MSRLVCVLMLLLLPATSAAQQPRDFSGTWQGRLAFSGVELRIVFHVERSGNGYAVSLDSPDQGAKGIPGTMTVAGDTMRVGIPSVTGSFEGVLDADGDVIRGTFRQGPAAIPLELRAGAIATAHRPQHPRPPYPYREEEVAFSNNAAQVRLAGTLTLPQTPGPHPVVVLVSGSGPQNRDEEIFEHRPFLVLADYLTRRGIAVLRYDDRGIGKSTGSFANATTADLAGDARAAVAYLKRRGDVDSTRIGVIGHSEGAVIAPIVAGRTKDVAFVVLMAGTGLRGDEVLFRQGAALARAAGADSATIAANLEFQRGVFEILRTEANADSARARIRRFVAESDLAITPAPDPDQVAAQTSPWLRHFISYDPAPALEKLRVPVLAIGGELDLQVPPEVSVDAVRAALERGGNARVTTRVFPRLNHLFQTATTGLPAEYGTIEETMSPAVLELIADWILRDATRAQP